MEAFKKSATSSAPKKSTLWHRYVDDTFALGRHVYQKPTFTNRYLYKDSNHHPVTKLLILRNFVPCTTHFCGTYQLSEELTHLEEAFKPTGM